MNTHKTRGFTIVELLVVIVVIGILAAITIVAYTGIRTSAVNSSMQEDLQTAYRTLSIYKINNGDTFPTSLSGIVSASNGSAFNYAPSSSPPTSYTLSISNSGSTTSYSITNTNNIPIASSPSAPVITTPASNISYNTDGCGPPPGYYYMSLSSAGTGSPAPTIQWQHLPKNTTTGTWVNISAGTAAYLGYTGDVQYDGDYELFRVIYTNSVSSVTSPTIKYTLTNGC